MLPSLASNGGHWCAFRWISVVFVANLGVGEGGCSIMSYLVCAVVSFSLFFLICVVSTQYHGLLHPTHAVLLTLSDAHRAHLPPRLPAHVRWARVPRGSLPPSTAVWRHPAVRLIVSSGEWPVLLEAAALGLPTLCIPSFVEQVLVDADSTVMFCPNCAP